MKLRARTPLSFGEGLGVRLNQGFFIAGFKI
jgi:hypothetical protein